MQGLKIRVQQSKVYIEMMKSLGAIGTPIAFTELYSALQQGVVDGQENPIATIRSMNYFEVQKHLSLTFHTYTPGAVMISPKLWNSLTAEQKAILQKTVNEAAAVPAQDRGRQGGRRPGLPEIQGHGRG